MIQSTTGQSPATPPATPPPASPTGAAAPGAPGATSGTGAGATSGYEAPGSTTLEQMYGSTVGVGMSGAGTAAGLGTDYGMTDYVQRAFMAAGLDPSLQSRINTGDAELKKRYGLDALQSEYDKYKTLSPNFGEIQKQYIRERDEYIKSIEAAEANLEQYKAKMNMADPMVANQVKVATDYLTTLKGRQQMDYDKYLKQAINEFNLKASAATTAYQGALDRYETAKASMANVTTEEYNTQLNMAKEAYTALKNAPIEAENLTNTRLNNQLAKLQIAKTLIETVKAEEGQTSTYRDLVKEYGPTLDRIIDVNEQKSAISNAVAINKLLTEAPTDRGNTMEYINKRFMDNIQSRINTEKNDPSYLSPLDAFNNAYDTYRAAYADETATPENKNAIAIAMGNLISKSLQPAISKEIGSVDDATLRTIVSDLYKIKATSLDENGLAAAKSKFIAAHADAVGANVLGPLFDFYFRSAVNPAAQGDVTLIFTPLTRDPKKEDIGSIKRSMTGALQSFYFQTQS